MRVDLHVVHLHVHVLDLESLDLLDLPVSVHVRFRESRDVNVRVGTCTRL